MKVKTTVDAHVGPDRKSPSSGRTALIQIVLGATMVVAGLAVICGLVWIGNSHDPLAQRLMFDLGLGLTGLISAGAQVLILSGAWLVWLSWPRAAGRQRDQHPTAQRRTGGNGG